MKLQKIVYVVTLDMPVYYTIIITINYSFSVSRTTNYYVKIHICLLYDVVLTHHVACLGRTTVDRLM